MVTSREGTVITHNWVAVVLRGPSSAEQVDLPVIEEEADGSLAYCMTSYEQTQRTHGDGGHSRRAEGTYSVLQADTISRDKDSRRVAREHNFDDVYDALLTISGLKTTQLFFSPPHLTGMYSPTYMSSLLLWIRKLLDGANTMTDVTDKLAISKMRSWMPKTFSR